MVLLHLLISSALAHYPHDPGVFVALSPDPATPWVVTTLWRTEAWMAARTANEGDMDVTYILNGDTRVVDPKYPLEIKGGRFLSGTRLAVATEGWGLWVSEDAGETWGAMASFPSDTVVMDLEVSPDLATDGIAIAVGTGGIWRTADRGDTWTSIGSFADTPFVDVSFSPDFATDGRVCAVDHPEGMVYCSSDKGLTFEARNAARGGAWQLALGSGTEMWMGSDANGLWHSLDDGLTWAAQGVFAGQPVTTLGWMGGGVLLATTKEQAVWRSADSGETWTLMSNYIQDASYGEGGPERDGNHYFEFQRAPDGKIWLASFEGLSRSSDEGLTWLPLETELQDTTRGLGFTRGQDGAAQALLGYYGSGVLVVNTDLSRAQSVSHTLPWRYLRSLGTTDAWAVDRTALVTGSGRLYGTVDGGVTWDLQVDPASGFGDLNYPNGSWAVPGYTEDPLFFVASGTGSIGEFAWSTDGGARWNVGTQDVRCTGGATAVMASWDFARDHLAWGACDGVVFRSSDSGKTWATLGDVGSHVYAIGGTPGGDRVFLATDRGLYRSNAGGAPALAGLEDEPVWALAISSDWDAFPYVYLATVRQGWFRSTDGGDTFEALSVPADAGLPVTMAISPDFATDGVVGVGGFGGAWISRDRGDTWSTLGAMELVQESQPLFLSLGGWEPVDDPEASGGAIMESLIPGTDLRLTFKGVGVDLLAPTGEDRGSFTVSVDEGPMETVDLAGDEWDRKRVWSSSVLMDGWHTLTMRAVTSKAAVDAAQVWHVTDVYCPDPGVPGRVEDTGDTDTQETAETGHTGETGGPDTVDTSSDSGGKDTGRETGVEDTGKTQEPFGRCVGCGSRAAGVLFLPMPFLWARRRKRT